MGFVAGYLKGGAGVLRKYLVASTVVDGEILEGASSGDLETQASTTALASVFGLGLDDVTYDATPNTATANIVTVDIRPDAIYSFRLAGSGTSGANLTILEQDTTSTTVLSDTGILSVDQDAGTLWRIQKRGDEANRQEIRGITDHVNATSVTIVTEFISTMLAGEFFLVTPHGFAGDGSGTGSRSAGQATFTSDVLEIDASVTADGSSGAVVIVYNIRCRSEADSELEFLVPAEHVFGLGTDAV